MTEQPIQIQLHKKSKCLSLVYATKSQSQPAQFRLSAELLRVYSPSAEVQGHGPGQEKLVDGKIDVGFSGFEAAGNYGVKIIFDDGHDSGIFTWEYLNQLCKNHESLWQRYMARLEAAGKSRDPEISVVQIMSPIKNDPSA